MSAAMHEQGGRSGRWAILGAAYVGIIAFAVVFQSVSPVLDLMIVDVGITHGQAGALMSYFALPGIIISLPAGALADRYGARIVGAISIVLMTAGSGMTALAGDFVLLATGRALAGTGAIALTIVLPRLISLWFERKELGFAMGLFNTGFPLGTILTLNAIGALGRHHGWTAAIHATTALSLAALAVFLLVARDPQTSPSLSGPERPAFSLRRLGVPIWFVGGSWLWINAAGISYLTFGTDYFLSSGAGAVAAGVLTSLLMAGSLFLSPLAGLLIDRGISQKTMIIAGSALISVVYLLIPLFRDHAFLLTICLGIAAALIPVSIFSLPARILPAEKIGAGFGVIGICLNTGVIIGPCMIGMARDWAGGYGAGFVMMAVFSLLSLLSIAGLRLARRND